MPELSIQTANEQGDRVTRTLHVEEEHAEKDRSTIQDLAEQAELVPELREERDDLASENDTLCDALVSEIVRRKKLSGELDGEDEIQDEREFLEGLPASRLKKHYERAFKLDIDTGGNLNPGKEPAGTTEGSTYDELGL
jgi:hypothetical protein